MAHTIDSMMWYGWSITCGTLSMPGLVCLVYPLPLSSVGGTAVLVVGPATIYALRQSSSAVDSHITHALRLARVRTARRTLSIYPTKMIAASTH